MYNNLDMAKRLTLRQQRFIDYYRGNATQAAIDAGYSPRTAYSIGQENLKKPEILEAIRNRNNAETAPTIASREDRQKFWSRIMNDTDVDLNLRLKASELLGKSEADFTYKVDAPDRFNPHGLADRLREARKRQTAYEKRVAAG